MTAHGVVVNARAGRGVTQWPSIAEQQALGIQWLRSIVYDLDEFEVALGEVAPGVRVVALLNEEGPGVGSDMSGWRACLEAFRGRFAGTAVGAIECGNEWDAHGVSAQDAAWCTSVALQVLRGSPWQVLQGSVAGPDWGAQLAAAVAALTRSERRRLHGVAFHPYGQRAMGFPAAFGFGELEAVIRVAWDAGQKPVWLTEFGIPIGDAGGEGWQAVYLMLAHAVFEKLPAWMLPCACWFAWIDACGAPNEIGDSAFGMRTNAGEQRPVWWQA